MPAACPLIKPAGLVWQEGQPYSAEFNDIYFSRAGGAEETRYVFLQHNGLPERWLGRPRFVIAETGFGSGLNFLVTVARWLETTDPDATLYYLSAEKHPLTKHDLQQTLAFWPEFAPISAELLENYPQLIAGYHQLTLCGGRVVLQLMFGEAEVQFAQCRASVDAWYLDGFAPDRNPAMWSPTLFGEIARLSRPGSTFATYTAAGAVRRGLIDAGFTVAKVVGFAGKREMLRGEFLTAAPSVLSEPWFACPGPVGDERTAAVIGAGLAGASTAHALVSRGWQVTLIERHPLPAQEASGNPAGVVLPRLTADMDLTGQWYLAAFLYTVRQLARWQQSHDIAWHPSGVLQLADEREIARFMALDLPDSVVRALDVAQARALAGVTPAQGGLFYPAGGWLSPPALCKAMIEASSCHIQTRYHQSAVRLDRVDDRWQVWEAGGDCLAQVGVVVLANGYRAVDMAQSAELPLQRVRGQLTMLAETSSSRLLRVPVCYDGYLVPAHQGQHVVGASYDSKRFDEELRSEEQKQILTHLDNALPGFRTPGDVQLAGRTASRTTSPDHLPLIGPLPDMDYYRTHYTDLKHGKPVRLFPPAQYHPGLYISTAHGSRGLVTCLPAAELLAAQICGEPMPFSSELVNRLHPARFMLRALRRG